MPYPKGKPKSEESKRKASESLRKAYAEGRHTVPPSVERECSVEGCDKPHVANGLCRMHYMRVERTGSTERTKLDQSTAPEGHRLCPDCCEAFPTIGKTVYCTPCGRRRRQISLWGFGVEDGDVCEICGSEDDLCIDHDHETNEARGIICRGCNVTLARVGDDLEGLERFRQYLLNHLYADA